MKLMSKCRVALLVATALGMSACNDGKDGNDGLPGEPGAPWVPPVVTTSAVAKVMEWQYAEGVVNVEFSVENQDGVPVEDLDKVQLMSTIKNEAGLLADTVDVTWVAGDDNAPGTLTHAGEGIYNLSMPHEAATSESIGTGYIRPGNGENGMPRTKRVMFTKNDSYAQVSTTDDAKCVACHGEFEDATGNATWGWHQHHHAIDNDQEVIIVEACLVCHTQTEQKDGGWAENTMAMLGHGYKYDDDGVIQASGHASLSKSYSMDKYRCSTCHVDDVVFTASLNGCATCHADLQDADKDLTVNHSNFTDLDCATCHNSFQHEHENGANRDEALNRYNFEIISVVRSEDKATIEVTTKATDSEGKVVDINALTDASPNGWATVMRNGEAMLPGRDEGHVARAKTAPIAGENGEVTYIITHALPYAEGEVLVGGVDGRISYTHRWGYPANAPISVSNIKDVRRTSSDGMKCLTCHTEGLDGHGSARGGFDLGGDACTQCHSAYNWAPGKTQDDGTIGDYAMAWGPFVHNMHFGAYKQDRGLNDMPTTDRNMPVDCQACHTGMIDLEDVAPAVVLNGMDESSVYGITAISANCATCHTGDAAKNHMIQQGGDFNVAITPEADMHTGESGDFAVFDPAPITESCSVCHSPARLAEAHNY
ncbi:multiheme c-type cytochrome [Shewanella sp. 10N.286.48.A6]|uniref:multiheme c-type cytochrome n=1 Tax=Shewanella sp. 10N.286.48.A6 TaxID=1880833 RepID=UPI000C818F5B|nr:hypothetical protein [Shewanella sp. 10N.286.48.A6]PMI01672.1 hypothetical protein BCU55_09690 [Shewanella sp. 10N.286.48.A6]